MSVCTREARTSTRHQLVLRNREAVLLIPMLYLREKQNIRMITTRQICRVALEYKKSLMRSQGHLADRIVGSVAPILKSLLESAAEVGIISKDSKGGYFIHDGFIRVSRDALKVLSEEDIREAERHTHSLCRAYLTA